MSEPNFAASIRNNASGVEMVFHLDPAPRTELDDAEWITCEAIVPGRRPGYERRFFAKYIPGERFRVGIWDQEDGSQSNAGWVDPNIIETNALTVHFPDTAVDLRQRDKWRAIITSSLKPDGWPVVMLQAP